MFTAIRRPGARCPEILPIGDLLSTCRTRAATHSSDPTRLGREQPGRRAAKGILERLDPGAVRGRITPQSLLPLRPESPCHLI